MTAQRLQPSAAQILARLGFTGDENTFLVQVASLIRDEKHFAQLLMKCDPAKRQAMYDSLRSRLHFRPKPLDVYESEAGQQAEREQLPTVDADGKFHAFMPVRTANSEILEKANQVMHREWSNEQSGGRRLLMTCAKCTRQETFYGETQVSAIIAARTAGWVYDELDGEPRETCPKCPAPRETVN